MRTYVVCVLGDSTYVCTFDAGSTYLCNVKLEPAHSLLRVVQRAKSGNTGCLGAAVDISANGFLALEAGCMMYPSWCERRQLIAWYDDAAPNR